MFIRVLENHVFLDPKIERSIVARVIFIGDAQLRASSSSQGIRPSLGCPYLRGSVAHPRALVVTIQPPSWSRMLNLRPLLACNSEQYFTSPPSDVWSETIQILVRKATLTRMPRKLRPSQRLASYLWARFKHLLEVVWQIEDHIWHVIRRNTFHVRHQMFDQIDDTN